jgi:hypothetical protein
MTTREVATGSDTACLHEKNIIDKRVTIELQEQQGFEANTLGQDGG